MFCYQCEQTVNGGCTEVGNCGKNQETGELHDLLLYVTQGISVFAHQARGAGRVDAAIDNFVIHALFTTVTNVDFDPDRIETLIKEAVVMRNRAQALLDQPPATLPEPAKIQIGSNRAEWCAQAEALGVARKKTILGEDITGLHELLKDGLLGAAAYADHAQVLGKRRDDLFAKFHEYLAYLATEPTDTDQLLKTILQVGALNLNVMELLDDAHTSTYGHPEPTQALITAKAGKAILVSGHDLKDLELLLQQTEGKNINIYTHGEMLPALAYPGLKKYPHLIGNYGGAWQNQRQEFEAFPGAILMTTNCIQKPKESYQARLFTTGLVGWPDVTHLADKDFAPVIKAALEAPGFAEDEKEERITIGFGHQAVLGVADKVVAMVKQGHIKHFYLIGGCDGAKPGRNYYSDAAQAVPQDSVILTLACGKYRFNKMPFGDIDGIPRLLDIGQCNDTYSAIKIAGALAEAFNTDVNNLPLTFLLSWYEQKAVAVLLTLLHLGIKNIKLGPTLPAFLTPNVVKILVDKFNIAPITNPQEDMQLQAATV